MLKTALVVITVLIIPSSLHHSPTNMTKQHLSMEHIACAEWDPQGFSKHLLTSECQNSSPGPTKSSVPEPALGKGEGRHSPPSLHLCLGCLEPQHSVLLTQYFCSITTGFQKWLIACSFERGSKQEKHVMVFAWNTAQPWKSSSSAAESLGLEPSMDMVSLRNLPGSQCHVGTWIHSRVCMASRDHGS